MTNDTQPQQKPLSERVRDRLSWLEHSSGALGHRLGIHPDAISLASLLVTVGAALAIGGGRLVLGGWLVFLGAWLDALDGAVARARGKPNPFGAVLDSTLDRYADGFIFASLSYYFAGENQVTLSLLPLAALVGSYSVSYVRARADAPDVQLSVRMGAFSRFERLVVVIVALWLPGTLLLPGLWLLAVGTNITALQRLWFVWKNTRDR